MAQISDTSPASITAVVARARLLMVISAATSAIAIGAVVSVIGYRVLQAGESGGGTDAVVQLPKGARIVSTDAAAGRIVVTLEVDGVSEIRTFDVKSLKQTGRLRFSFEP